MNSKFAAAVAGLAVAVTMFSTGSAMAVVTPMPMYYFCAANPAECATTKAAKVTVTPDLLAVLEQTTKQFNRAIRPQRDSLDVWELNPRRGDCEDYALSKRSSLINQGVPAGSLRIAFTHTRRGEPHAVLIVRTSQGDLVLDNLNNSVKTLSATGYNIRSMSSANPLKWIAG